MHFENGHLVVLAAQHAVMLQLGPFALRWYPLAYLTGVVAGWALMRKMLTRPAPPLTAQNIGDLVTWIFLGVLLGGRIGYVLFYNFAEYAAHPLEALKIWEGGMSFHGAALGVLAAVFLYARRHHLSTLRIMDYIVVVEPIGQGLGRIANFLNGELWGAPTTLPWGVIFRGADPIDIPRHPSQLYEAFFEGAVLFAVLSFLFWKTDIGRRPGFLTGAYMLGFGIIRFFLEFIREPDSQLIGLTGPLHMGQWLCLPMILIGGWLMLRARKAPLAPIQNPPQQG